MESPIIDTFPEDLLLEILLKLPVKSLVRFKCVSKSWFSHVSDANFTKLHFDLTAPNNQLLLKVSLGGFHNAQICSIDLEGSLDEHLTNFISPISSLQVNYIRILGVCRGFILLAYSFRSVCTPPCFLVWNPSTGVHRTLPPSPMASNFHPKYVLEQVCFEYDASRDDYSVVIAWIEPHYNSILFRVNCFEFFSLRTNSWRQVNTPENRWWCSGKQVEFSFVNGYIHWLSINDTAIIAFDSIARNVSRIHLPYDGFVRDYDVMSLRLEVIEGCLYLLSFPRKQASFVKLWTMKEYKVESSWIMSDYMPAYVLEYDLPHYYFRPIYFNESGAIVGLDDSYMTMIVKVNDKGKLLSIYDHRSCFQRKYHIYVKSLLSLPNEGAQA